MVRPTTITTAETDPTPATATTSVSTTEEDETPIFSEWREFNINDDDDDDVDADADVDVDAKDVSNGVNSSSNNNHNEQDTAGLFCMFDTQEEEDVYEDVRYDYPSSLRKGAADASNSTTAIDTTTSSTTTSVTIRHHNAYPNSTGLAVWRGAEIMARFLCNAQQTLDSNSTTISNACTTNTSSNNDIRVAAVRNKRVLEVGAGAGLPSIVAHKILGAAKVLVTDGDFDALNNLKHNVDRNRLHCDAADASTTGTSTSTSSNNSIVCSQLIWGHQPHIDAILAKHGKQDVVLMADCVYMVPSLKPLWETIDKLLVGNSKIDDHDTHDDNDNDDGIVVYVQTAASAVPWERFKSTAVDEHGFETLCCVVSNGELRKYKEEDGSDSDDDDDNDGDNSGRPSGAAKHKEEFERGIYVFRRRRRR